MPVKEKDVPLGTLQRSSGGTRFVPDTNQPLRCMACNRLMDPDFALEIESRCPNCKTKFKKKDWAKMAAEAMQVKTQGGWNRDTLERFEDEQSGNPAYIAPDKTTNKQNEKARNMAKWAIQQKRKAEKLKKIRTWGGSGISNLLASNPYR